MFKDYLFFSNNLQDAARQILEAQTAGNTGSTPPGREERGWGIDVPHGQHPIFPEKLDPIFPEGQEDSSDEPKIRNVNKTYDPRFTPKPMPPGETPPPNNYNDDDDDAPTEDETSEYKKTMMDSIVKDITKRYSKPENISIPNPLDKIDKNKTKNILPMQ